MGSPGEGVKKFERILTFLKTGCLSLSFDTGMSTLMRLTGSAQKENVSVLSSF